MWHFPMCLIGQKRMWNHQSPSSSKILMMKKMMVWWCVGNGWGGGGWGEKLADREKVDLSTSSTLTQHLPLCRWPLPDPSLFPSEWGRANWWSPSLSTRPSPAASVCPPLHCQPSEAVERSFWTLPAQSLRSADPRRKGRGQLEGGHKKWTKLASPAWQVYPVCPNTEVGS